ncbi:hypothetical protein GCM10022225_76850 [Plantactinospora mayteni]|uniref:Uncharacterized protein n=1 Tax=Plantactinospora mayteni TaxID=566021 RepID=A0ABQ4F232_9ACTN|nr:hypothetical protein Pma05_75540 [Plantactinospora mayteni]
MVTDSGSVRVTAAAGNGLRNGATANNVTPASNTINNPLTSSQRLRLPPRFPARGGGGTGRST